MKIELNENKIYFNSGKSIQEIHPFWLRERVDGEEFLDKGTQQRLFDPSVMSSEIVIEKAIINEGFLEINFNDGVSSKLEIDKIASEFTNKDTRKTLKISGSEKITIEGINDLSPNKINSSS